MILKKFDKKPTQCKNCKCAKPDRWNDNKKKLESDWERVKEGTWKCLICNEVTEIEIPPYNDFIHKMDVFLVAESNLDKARDDVSDRLREVVDRWWKATGRTVSDEMLWDNWEFEEWRGEIYLTFAWEVSWQYGGHNEGTFSVPFKYFYDEDALKELERSMEKNREKEKVNNEKKDKKNRRREYEKLKKEFENEGD